MHQKYKSDGHWILSIWAYTGHEEISLTPTSPIRPSLSGSSAIPCMIKFGGQRLNILKRSASDKELNG